MRREKVRLGATYRVRAGYYRDWPEAVRVKVLPEQPLRLDEDAPMIHFGGVRGVRAVVVDDLEAAQRALLEGREAEEPRVFDCALTALEEEDMETQTVIEHAHNPTSGGAQATTYLPDVATLRSSFQRYLRKGIGTGNKSQATMVTYLESVDQLEKFLRSKGMPTVLEHITREHLESWIEDMANQGRSEATLLNRYQGVHAFFRWAVKEDEITANPMDKMERPRVHVQPVPLLEPEQVEALLATTKGKGFEQRRDRAILQVFLGSGIRLSELTGIRFTPNNPETNDVGIDGDPPLLRVMGKGGSARWVAVTDDAMDDIERYLRARRLHPHANRPELWLGRKGAMTPSGIRQMVWRRSEEAGIPRVHPHQLRHQFSHSWLAAGGSEGGLMQQNGWRSRAMAQRYASSAAVARAHEEHKRLFGGGS